MDTCFKCHKVCPTANECNVKVSGVDDEDEVEVGGVWMIGKIDINETDNESDKDEIPIAVASACGSQCFIYCLIWTLKPLPTLILERHSPASRTGIVAKALSRKFLGEGGLGEGK